MCFVLLHLFLAAAPANDDRKTDYQAVADASKWDWKWTAEPSLDKCSSKVPKPYKIDSAFKNGHARIGIAKDGKEVYHWRGHAESVLLILGDVLYHSEHGPTSSGCIVRAVDLTTGKAMWSTHLKGIGPADYSKYRNQVHLETYDMGTLRVFGFESAGSYVEFLDRRTGKTVGHRVFTAEEMRPRK